MAELVVADESEPFHSCLSTPAIDPEVKARWEQEALPVGDIDIQLSPVFDVSKPEENNWLFRLVNRLHIDTDENVIREDLLFQEGEPFTARTLEESERVLRTRRYLRNVKIVPSGSCEKKVDLQVQAREVWTLVPDIGYSHKGGQSTSRFGINDKNFLGTGKSVAFRRENEAERSSNVLSYKDVNFTDLRAILDLEYGDTSDGQYYNFELGRPFYSLDARWLATSHAFDSKRVDSVYLAGDAVDEFSHHEQSYELAYGWSDGLKGGAVSRWSAGIRLQQDEFEASFNTLPAGQLPRDRRLQYPWLGYQYINEQFITARNVNQIGIVEDLNTGWEWSWKLGYARASSLNMATDDGTAAHDDNALVLSLSARRDILISTNGILGLKFYFDGQHQDGDWQNSVANLSLKYHHGDFSTHQFFAGLEVNQGWNLPIDRLFYLGGDNGLRGYPRNYQGGDQSATLTLEERFYLQEEWLSLADVGAAVFYDIGRASGLEDRPTDWLQDVGVGLRISPTRTGAHRHGHNTVLHLDLAAPIKGPSGVDRWQWLVQVKQSF